MTSLILWLEYPNCPPEALTLEDDTPVSRLKADLLDRLPAGHPENKKRDIEVVCLRTGTILREGDTPISYLVKDGDHFILREAFSTYSSAETTKTETAGSASFNAVPIVPESRDSPPIQSLEGTFSITGIAPFPLNFSREYPVFAIRCRYEAGAAVRHVDWFGPDRPQPRGRVIYAKDYFFLTADQAGQFKWVSADQSGYYLPNLVDMFREPDHRKLTRYSLGKDHGECENMIYPVRPFSITGISMDGFDPNKEYPVLAIDTDQYIKENPESAEEAAQEPQPSTQSIAFFLVGDDNGEFAWIAEDECRLFPLTVTS